MKNYDDEIHQLRKDIENLNLERLKKETELQRILKRNQESKKNKESSAPKVKVGRIILKGDRVKATTPGKCIHNEGKVVEFQIWVTFEDITRVKQVRAPHNLLVCNNDRKRNVRVGNTNKFNQKSCTDHASRNKL